MSSALFFSPIRIMKRILHTGYQILLYTIQTRLDFLHLSHNLHLSMVDGKEWKNAERVISMLHWWMFLKCIHIYLLLKQHMKYCTCLSRHITHSELSPLARMDSCLTRGAEGAGWSKVTSSWNRKDCWTYIKYIHGTSTAQALHAYQYITDLLSIKIMIHTNIIEVLCFILIYGHWLTFLNFFKVTLSRICKWMANDMNI